MRALVWVVLGCGCNQVFDLRETVAQQFDAGTDAPFACPPVGTQPVFSAGLEQAIAKNCVSYTTSVTANRAAAHCVDIDAIADGAIDTVPQRATLTPDDRVDWPRLSPEGDELWVRRRAPLTGFSVYRYVNDHHWTHVRDLAIAGAALDDIITAPSRRIGGVRRFVRYAFNEFKLYEYTDDGSTTSVVRTYDAQTLGVYFVQFPNLDADGLRLVFVGQASGSMVAQTFYADRAQLDDPFSSATPLATAPLAYDPFLAQDCSRLYTSGLGSIFYAQQL